MHCRAWWAVSKVLVSQALSGRETYKYFFVDLLHNSFFTASPVDYFNAREQRNTAEQCASFPPRCNSGNPEVCDYWKVGLTWLDKLRGRLATQILIGSQSAIMHCRAWWAVSKVLVIQALSGRETYKYYFALLLLLFFLRKNTTLWICSITLFLLRKSV